MQIRLLHHSLRIVALLLILLPLSVSYMLLGQGISTATLALLFVLNLSALVILGIIFYRFISLALAGPGRSADCAIAEPDALTIDQLKRDIAERTGRLEAVQRELEKSERLATLGQLTAKVGHELKNAIASIRLATDVLTSRLGAEQGEETSTVIERIYRNIHRSEQIIQELKEQAQDQPLRLERLPLKGFIEQLRNDYVHSHDIEISWSYPEHITLQCDPGKLERACINVLDNACHALLGSEMADRSIQVSVREESGRISLVFDDNGPGIPEHLRTQVLEPLFTTKSSGLGLGLSIVSEIMEKHHGGLHIEGRGVAGARVVLWLPHREEQ